MQEKLPPLTSAEIGYLWNMYMQDTLIACVKKYFVAKCEDEQILAVLKQALDTSDKRSKDIAAIFKSCNLSVPVGYTDKDVNIQAPPLYSDTLALHHALSRSRWALITTSRALYLSVRPDVRKLFRDAITSCAKLNEDAIQTALAKGLLTRSPIVSIPESPHFVEESSYLGSIFGKHRPLHVVSLAHLFLSIQENTLGRALILGFSQVAQDPEVRKYFIRGAEISSKHIKIFTSLINSEDIPVPQSSDYMITNSTIPPFSDKLMMNHILTLSSIGMADMALAMGESNRADIAADYVRLASEVVQYGEDGINIMIKNGWMEAAPQVLNHKEMAQDSSR